MSAQQTNFNLQYQQQLQQQHDQQALQQQHEHNPQDAQQAQQQRRKKKTQQPVKKKTFPTLVSPEMRDRQARGKNTHRRHEDDGTDEDEYDDEDDEDEDEQIEGHNARDDDDDEDEEDSEDGKTNSSSFSYRSEPFESRERRAYALAVLDRPEQLMMYANTTNDSVAGQRVRFTRMMCGFDDETDWRNNLHYKAALAAAKERQIKVRRGASIPRDF